MKAGRLFILFGNVTQVFLHSNGQSAFGLANIQHMTQSAAYHIDNVAAIARERMSDGERRLWPPDFGVVVHERTGFTVDLGAGVCTRCNCCFTMGFSSLTCKTDIDSSLQQQNHKPCSL